MKRVTATFLIFLALAVFSSGQLWRSVRALVGGSAGPMDFLTMAPSAVFLALAMLVLGRILYLTSLRRRNLR
jgi:hypothetical protein